MSRFSRREFIASMLGPAAAALAGCADRRLPRTGEMLSPNFHVGHKIRDSGRAGEGPQSWQDVAVVIVGGGIAGLSAAWRLRHAGCRDFAVLELERERGGTSRAGQSQITPFPWGAHYVTVPLPQNRALIRLLSEMNVLDAVTADGTPQVAEQFLCRDPQERLFVEGRWIEGLYPYVGATRTDRSQLEAFKSEVGRWVAWRDSRRRRAFAVPTALGSDDPQVTRLDEISMADWLDQRGFDSPRLRWLIDYSCRDDYGLTAEQTSAWAGLFYFASRVRRSGDEPQPVITWPQGNGRFVEYLSQCTRPHVRAGKAVTQIVPPPPGETSKTRVVVLDTATGAQHGYQAGQVIFAAPQYVAPYVIRTFQRQTEQTSTGFQYGSWLVANVHLRGRPRERGFPLCWDNVLYESKSLGYVVATHQSGLDYGPTVLTWYYAFCDDDPAARRALLLEMTWEDCAQLVLADLAIAHPGICDLVVRLDVMRWGHAMIQPRPGFVWGTARRQAVRPHASIHFANTDLSGVALMEEAFYHGVRAAEEVLAASGTPVPSFL